MNLNNPVPPKLREKLRLQSKQADILKSFDTSIVRRRLAWFDQPLKKVMRLEKQIVRLDNQIKKEKR